MARPWLSLCVAAAIVLGAHVASPTTLIPPTFDELVSQAATIFRGEVVDRRSEWETTAAGRSIVTIVTFDVIQVLKGSPTTPTQLTFLGGTVGDVTMQVAKIPEFRLGDRDVLFVSGDLHAASPIVGFAYGRFRVVHDPVSGADVVRTHDGRPMASTENAAAGLRLTPRTVPPMEVREFEAIVRQRLAALSGR
jgi:hypothetical protein